MDGESTNQFPEFEIQIRDIHAGITTSSAKKTNINATKEHFLKVAEIVEAAGDGICFYRAPSGRNCHYHSRTWG